MTLMLTQPRIDISAPVAPSASFDPPVIRPGETAIYRLTFDALEDAIVLPAPPAAPAGLTLAPGAHGQILQLIGTNYQPRTSFNYRARSSTTGTFVIPEFTVQVDGKPVTVPAARLEVQSTPPPGIPVPQQLALQILATNLFVGQPARVRVTLHGSPGGGVQVLNQVQLAGQGFIVDKSAISQRIEPVLAPNTKVSLPAFIYETSLIPIAPGSLSVTAQAFVGNNPFSVGTITISSPAVIVNSPGRYKLLESDPLELSVRSLPQDEPPGFTGGIGGFSLDRPRLSTNDIRVGELVQMTVTVNGRGNIGRLTAPPPPVSAEWQIFSGGSAAAQAPQRPAAVMVSRPNEAFPTGSVTFVYTLIPLIEQARSTPAIPFSFFDPDKAAYRDLTIPPVPVTVRPGAAPADLPAFVAPEPGPSEKPLKLSGLADSPGLSATTLIPLQERTWFPLVQLGPAAGFAGLWAWARRRRYLEAHPGILLRRAARRGLRRHRRAMSRALQEGDAARFAIAAAEGLRAVCAPHFPAQPRALVARDVLEVLDHAGAPETAAGVVRRTFTAADAACFDSPPGKGAETLSMAAEIEEVLQFLEEKL